nr:glycosyltransferase [uncultured Holophaga sp.]
MSQLLPPDQVPLPEGHTVLFYAPFYNRSGYGLAARSLAAAWARVGIRFRIMPVDLPEEGIDDFDMDWLRSLETTELTRPLAAVFFHVPSRIWLELELPPDCLRIMYTTFDSSAQGNLPPEDWVSVCSQMDQVWLQTEQEADVWAQAGIPRERIHVMSPPHAWVENPSLPPLPAHPHPGEDVVRFLCIGMYQPRRRWDSLIQAFLEEFAGEPRAELMLKVNFPSWHPVPGAPRREFLEMVSSLQQRIPSRARVVVDEELGTRLGICRVIDRCDFYVSTDTCLTAPIMESLVRGKRVILPSYGSGLPVHCFVLIPEDPAHTMPMTPEMLAYQPHHRGRPMPLLHVRDIREALRRAWEIPEEARLRPWPTWGDFMAGSSAPGRNPAFRQALAQAWASQGRDHPTRLCWEGAFFRYHSLAHVNRQLGRRLVTHAGLEVRLLATEGLEFDPRLEPGLASRVDAPLSGPVDVHVRHQWPPHFEPPPSGAWVVVQPWEFGGIPASWVPTFRDQVDEIWVPSAWVRDCYIQSGIPADQVHVVPNGVDPLVFSPEGPTLPLPGVKGFRFLFVGGTIHRKGIDILLRAYARAFRARDEVTLVIKGQAGGVYPGSDLAEALEVFRQDPGAPGIEYLDSSLDEAGIAALYRACQVLVLPYRGEGFGLPLAEAMASGLPVITTAKGPSSDFVPPDCAWLLPSETRPIPTVDGLRPAPCGFWLEEPLEEALVEALQEARRNPGTTALKGQLARSHAETSLGWERGSAKVLERLAQLRVSVPRRLQRRSGPPRELPRCLFLLTPDLSRADWARTLLAYAHAFQPGDPVVLGLQAPEPARERLGQDVLYLMSKAGHTTFADVMLVEDEGEISTWTREGGEIIDLDSPQAAPHPLYARLERSLALFRSTR